MGTPKKAAPRRTKTVSVARSLADNAAAARLLRRAAAEATKRGRGHTVSPNEQATAAAIAKAIGRAKAPLTTEVTITAGAKGRCSRLVVAVDVALFAQLVRAVAKLVGDGD
jgi:hypothetical protein